MQRNVCILRHIYQHACSDGQGISLKLLGKPWKNQGLEAVKFDQHPGSYSMWLFILTSKCSCNLFMAGMDAFIDNATLGS